MTDASADPLALLRWMDPDGRLWHAGGPLSKLRREYRFQRVAGQADEAEVRLIGEEAWEPLRESLPAARKALEEDPWRGRAERLREQRVKADRPRFS